MTDKKKHCQKAIWYFLIIYQQYDIIIHYHHTHGTSTLMGHFVSSLREREKRERQKSKIEESGKQMRMREK